MTWKRAARFAALLILLAGGVRYFLLRGGGGAEASGSPGTSTTTVEVSFRIPGGSPTGGGLRGMTVARDSSCAARQHGPDRRGRAREAELSAADAALGADGGSEAPEIARAEAEVGGARRRNWPTFSPGRGPRRSRPHGPR